MSFCSKAAHSPYIEKFMVNNLILKKVKGWKTGIFWDDILKWYEPGL